MGKTIHVSDQNWENLQKLKIELRKRSMDEVIAVLLSNYQKPNLQEDKVIERQNYNLQENKDKFTEIQTYKNTELSFDKMTTDRLIKMLKDMIGEIPSQVLFGSLEMLLVAKGMKKEKAKSLIRTLIDRGVYRQQASMLFLNEDKVK
ncbi:MAG: hypothetical protein J7K33_09860 [Candidatus Marinimicrobia bacterium]|nr:hypothetical protein [Candidatus Neomarinimicrobiota bacterium]